MLLVLLVVGLAWHGRGVERLVSTSQEEWTEVRSLELLRTGRFGDCAHVFYYRSSSVAYAEYFGAGFAGLRPYEDLIGQQYGPNIFIITCGAIGSMRSKG
jgi:hypothetical protein